MKLEVEEPETVTRLVEHRGDQHVVKIGEKRTHMQSSHCWCHPRPVLQTQLYGPVVWLHLAAN